MIKVLIIGFVSVFSNCSNKTVISNIELNNTDSFTDVTRTATVQLSNTKSFTDSGHRVIATHWFMAKGPRKVTFDHQDSPVVNATIKMRGRYIIGNWVKDDRNLIDTGYCYINAQ